MKIFDWFLRLIGVDHTKDTVKNRPVSKCTLHITNTLPCEYPYGCRSCPDNSDNQ